MDEHARVLDEDAVWAAVDRERLELGRRQHGPQIRDTARRHAAAPPKRLTGQIRAMAGSERRAPGVSHLEPLLDHLVHGQDIAVPLRRLRPMPLDAAATAATRAWTMGWPVIRAFRARARLRDLRLIASDASWSAGAGVRVEGPIEALLLLLTGRTAAALDRLGGDGVPLLAVTGPSRRWARPASEQGRGGVTSRRAEARSAV